MKIVAEEGKKESEILGCPAEGCPAEMGCRVRGFGFSSDIWRRKQKQHRNEMKREMSKNKKKVKKSKNKAKEKKRKRERRNRANTICSTSAN